MAQVISNCKCWCGKYDMSGYFNSVAINDAPMILDNTTINMTARSRKRGLNMVTAAIVSLWDQNPDDFAFDLGTTGVPITFGSSATDGDRAWAFLSQNTSYQNGANVGELLKLNINAESYATKLIHGNILVNGTKATTANGTAFELGAVSASQYLYGCLHVTAAQTAVGDTLDVIIQSAPLGNFAAPTTRITFTQVLGNGGATFQWATPVVGAIADTWWRAQWTIVEADDADFTIAVFMGIQ